MNTRSGILMKAAATLTLALTTTACATLLRGAFSKAGIEDRSSNSPGSASSTAAAPALSTARTHSGNGQTSTYQQMPTPRLWMLGRGPVHSPAYSISRWAQNNPCAPMPEGIEDVLPVSQGAPVTDVASLGPIHLEAFGVPAMYVGGLVRQDGFDLSGQMMEQTARMAAYGQECGPNLFFGLRFGSANPVNPVPVEW